jgi:ubiquinone/menaquinone biosynthesis C-methylase UbiE
VSKTSDQPNIDPATVAGFGAEWSAFDQSRLTGKQYEHFFDCYFSIFPFDELPPAAEGFDLGCGSGRWALGVAPRVGTLHCIDPSIDAINVARRRLEPFPNIQLHVAAADSIPLPDKSQDFGYSLGVLHHVPNTGAALANAVAKLKVGAPFLLYLYYSLDNRPGWFRALWKATDQGRKLISRLPFPVRRLTTDAIALTIYWPMSRLAKLAEKAGLDPELLPLSSYRAASLYTLRTDALDRFGTRLEHRFSGEEIERMMVDAGLEDIRFSERPPYWVACGFRKNYD